MGIFLHMVNFTISKISSKGQIVIPKNMRKNFSLGEKILIIEDKKKLILEKANDFSKKYVDDLKFSVETEKARKRILKGGDEKEKDLENFVKKLKNNNFLINENELRKCLN